MPRIRIPSSRLLRRRAVLLAAGAAALFMVHPAAAQNAGLRGEVTEADVRRELVSRPSPLYPVTPTQEEQQQAANPAYVPEGPRATEGEETPEADTLTTLFPDPPTDANSLGEPEKPETPTGVRRRPSA